MFLLSQEGLGPPREQLSPCQVRQTTRRVPTVIVIIRVAGSRGRGGGKRVIPQGAEGDIERAVDNCACKLRD
ncbi:MAG: hypothetical protein AAFY41_09075 [Bacteroidota bacterium]